MGIHPACMIVLRQAGCTYLCRTDWAYRQAFTPIQVATGIAWSLLKRYLGCAWSLAVFLAANALPIPLPFTLLQQQQPLEETSPSACRRLSLQMSSGSRPSLRCCSAITPFGCAWALRQLLGSCYLLRQASLWALTLHDVRPRPILACLYFI